MIQRKTIKLLAITIFCLLLALLLGAQAFSSVLTRKGPEQAVSLLSHNGLAREQLAFRKFQEAATAPEEVQSAALLAKPDALTAISLEPLVPKAYAILAASIDDPAQKSAILSLASRLNRRDIALQGLVLEQALAEGDYDQVVTTLDQILRVHPNFREQFYPVLLQALSAPEAAPTFVRLLDGASPWHEDFLLRAARQGAVQPVLASVRGDLFINDIEFDRRLIAGLVQQGAFAEATRVYDFVRAGEGKDDPSEDALSWQSDFPPFDWKLADENDFRGQTSLDGESLEIYARSGQGGVVAQRILPMPKSPFPINMRVEAGRELTPQNLRIQLRCSDARNAFFEEALRPGRNQILVSQVPEECPGLSLELYARAMSGEPTLRAEVGRITLGSAE
ncbi:hypothetical protein [Erythrobacter sp.]|uniref:hypothetical protein n=1 Tax=Erythrobacter sp. TaxID=1042 RepID=UPI001425BF88|nr:hypothetical protein [Erythrobacter sp.]QIQ87555.1 MAG: hypothetical protein G9473_13330 [Erythrobacter sp.]